MITAHGIKPPQGALGRSMPGRGDRISDEEMAALLRFVRARFSREPPWEGVEAAVRAARGGR
jgi:mono/diheme cytochrome c family protein